MRLHDGAGVVVVALVSAVVFDLDGTLFDHPGSARRGLRAWLGGLGVVLTEDLTAAWFDAEDRHWAAWRQGLVTVAEQRRRRLREFLPLVAQRVGSDDELDAVFADYSRAYQRAWAGYDDVDAALAQVRGLGVLTAVLTNGTEDQQRAELAHLGLLEAIGPVFTAEALGVAKPHPEAFHLVCDRLGLPAAQVLYVGDDHEVDVLGARAAGLRAVHLDRTGSRPDDEREWTASLDGLVPHITGAAETRR